MSEYTTRQILDMIEANGGPERLDLSEKDLSGIDLSRDTILVELARVRETNSKVKPTWVSQSTTYRGINLLQVGLQEANLSEANLQGAYLAEANLQGAKLRGADLREACLLDSNLEGANLDQANLQGSGLFDANFRGAHLWGANLQGAQLWGSNLQGTSLHWTNLQGADLRNANLQGAKLWGTGVNLQGANLHGADLTGVSLLDARSIEGTSLYRAILDHTQLTKDQLGSTIVEELRGEWFAAKEAYLALKNNFEQIGRYDDAAWAYRRERRMEKLEALQKAKEAFGKQDWREAARNYTKVAGDQLVELICDYGESIWRVLGAMLAAWLIFALVYGLIAGVWGAWQKTVTGQVRYITRSPVDLLSFSLGAMTTLEPADLEARSMVAMRILMPLEALLGIALAGLLGFVVGNRIRRS